LLKKSNLTGTKVSVAGTAETFSVSRCQRSPTFPGGSRMSQNQASKWVRCVVCYILAATLPIGCNPFATHRIEVYRDEQPIKPAEYPLTYKDKPKKGEEFVVAVFVSSTPEIRKEFDGIEGQLVSDTAKKLQEMARESKQKLVVLDPTLVNKFKKKNPTWNRMHPSQWGVELGVDYVLDIHLNKMSLYQPGSSNQIYEGQAEVAVDVYDVGVGIAEPKYHYIDSFKYPQTGVLNATSIPVIRFKFDLLDHLAAELALKHVEHKVDSGIAEEK